MILWFARAKPGMRMNHGRVNNCVKEDKTQLNTLRQAKVNTQVASKNKLQHKKLELMKPTLDLNMDLQTSQQQC